MSVCIKVASTKFNHNKNNSWKYYFMFTKQAQILPNLKHKHISTVSSLHCFYMNIVCMFLKIIIFII